MVHIDLALQAHMQLVKDSPKSKEVIPSHSIWFLNVTYLHREVSFLEKSILLSVEIVLEPVHEMFVALNSRLDDLL